MARADNAWSHWVAWLKIVLPLIALGLLSSIFLLSRTIDPTATLPFTEVDVTDRAREPRLTAPQFSGVTQDGALVTLDASDMRPSLTNPGSGSGTDLRARMTTPDGAVTDAVGDTGRIDTTAGTYELAGSVRVSTSSGYSITAPRMQGSLTVTELDATGPVQADAPMGRITADAMQLRPDPSSPGQYLLVFKGDVRLVYLPQN